MDSHTISRRALLELTGSAAFAGALGPEASGADGPQAKKEPAPAGKPLRIVDTHIHTTSPNVPGLKPKPADVDRLMNGPPEKMAERLREEMAAAGVAAAFGMGGLGGPPEDPLGIGPVLKVAAHTPGLKAVGIIDPRRTEPDHLRAVEAQVAREKGRKTLVAFKAYLGYLHFGPEHENYAPYYEIAARHKLPVILHTGDNWSTRAKLKYAHPLRVDEAAVDHPGVQFVTAHFGNPWLVDAAEVMFKNPNVWADLSGLFVGDAQAFEKLIASAREADSGFGLIVADLKKALGYVESPERFLYGSDWPLAPMASYRRLIEAILPAEWHEPVFSGNARRLFGIQV